MCEDCKVRFEKNPLRILDCKNEKCIQIFENPEIKNLVEKSFICDECSEHFAEVKSYLDSLNIKYTVNPKLVRGLDYYNRTVFEIKASKLGSQNAVCGGGRYDGLVEMLGGNPTPAVGRAMGMERLSMLIDKKENRLLEYFIISDNTKEAFILADELRRKGYSCDYDYRAKKFNKQLEKALKVAKNAVIIGEDELKTNSVTVKNFDTTVQKTVLRKEFLENI